MQEKARVEKEERRRRKAKNASTKNLRSDTKKLK
jgi:hypothetical protein